MMSLLIPGRSSPGRDIDVYLRLLIDELEELWEDGVQTYSSSNGETFQMHAAIMWTITAFLHMVTCPVGVRKVIWLAQFATQMHRRNTDAY